jgi:hypothetical protein
VSKFFYCYRMVASKFYQMAGSWLAKKWLNLRLLNFYCSFELLQFAVHLPL